MKESGRIRRLTALVRKETYQVIRDPSSILIAFVLPLILLFLFGYGVSLDATRTRIGVVVETARRIRTVVTEQLDALRVMGADPIRYLVVPRFTVCMILLPILTIYSDFLGIIGGWIISTKFLGVADQPYWQYAAQGVDTWQIMEGVVKSFFFGGAIGLISCYKGFTCGAGASGVGKACTESFVKSFLAIIVLNFFFAEISKQWYVTLYGTRSLFG